MGGPVSCVRAPFMFGLCLVSLRLRWGCNGHTTRSCSTGGIIQSGNMCQSHVDKNKRWEDRTAVGSTVGNTPRPPSGRTPRGERRKKTGRKFLKWVIIKARVIRAPSRSGPAWRQLPCRAGPSCASSTSCLVQRCECWRGLYGSAAGRDDECQFSRRASTPMLYSRKLTP